LTACSKGHLKASKKRGNEIRCSRSITREQVRRGTRKKSGKNVSVASP